MTKQRQKLGQWGESLSVNYLESIGYKIIESNYYCDIGEIDIIAQDRDTLCFVEVKTRLSDDLGHPLEAVTRHKQYKLIQMASIYLQDKGLEDVAVRFDVISILGDDPKTCQIELICDAFHT